MKEHFKVEFIRTITAIDKDEWQEVVATDYPFIQYDFFHALESSQSTCAASGWQPFHLVLKQEGQLVGLMPLFIKSHSYGEYVFDFAWANAFAQSGRHYYPKLLSAIPFTPVSGKRLYLSASVSKDEDSANTAFCQVIEAISIAANNIQASSWHLLFADKVQSNQLVRLGVAQRLGIQYHWQNQSYTQFDDFLAACKSRYRKNIRRERRLLAQQAIETRMLEGKEITESVLRQFFRFYQLTYFKKSGHGGYLTEDFFNRIRATLARQLVMGTAQKNGQIVACALFFKDHKTLYGRYWGCERAYEFLHFELCYYRGIEYCIEHGLQNFDAGAQGEHKISRGFVPRKTYSNHWISDKLFSRAIEDSLSDEKIVVERQLENLRELLPFKG